MGWAMSMRRVKVSMVRPARRATMPTGGTSRGHIADAPVTTVVATEPRAPTSHTPTRARCAVPAPPSDLPSAGTTVMCVGSILSPLISSEEAYGPGRDASSPRPRPPTDPQVRLQSRCCTHPPHTGEFFLDLALVSSETRQKSRRQSAPTLSSSTTARSPPRRSANAFTSARAPHATWWPSCAATPGPLLTTGHHSRDATASLATVSVMNVNLPAG